MQFITSTKLQELEKQRIAYLEHAKVIEEAEKVVDDLPTKVETLLKAILSWTGSGSVEKDTVIGGKLNLEHLETWLLQAKMDPSFSQDILRSWAETLETHILHNQTRFDCAKLFGNLFNEWLSSGDSQSSQKPEDSNTMETAEPQDTSAPEEQKARLAALIFEEKEVDTTALVAYLSELFSGEFGEPLLEKLRDSNQEFGLELQRESITTDDVEATISSLLASDLMDLAKRDTLREMLNSPIVLDEVASVLNMRLASLNTWSWPESGLVMEMRRYLNWKYRAFSDPEILDALLLQYLGGSWQVQFKRLFKNVFRSRAWKSGKATLSKAELERRRYFLSESDTPQSVETHRTKLREDRFMVSQLMSEFGVSSSYYDSPNSSQTSSGSVHQELLHLMITDCYLNKVLHGQHTVVRTDLEMFGPSLPHASILALLKFFGVSEEWLQFFKTFLQAPIRFKNESTAAPRTRLRGTPISYALSALCGEVILFGLDLAANQRGNGTFLYRIHDDIYFWDSNPQNCVDAWKEMNHYAELVGIKFNRKKTGAVCVGAPLVTDLPPGEVRWGFLRLDADLGRFVIDQKDITVHIKEMRRQLSMTKSVFGWVNNYNKYIKFMVRSFGGRPAACFGQELVDDMIHTLARLQREVFPQSETSGSAVGHLRSLIEKRFGVKDLPQGYFYFPIGSGGLQVHDPLVELMSLRSSIEAHPVKKISDRIEADAQDYRELKERWDTTSRNSGWDGDPVEFFSFEEYISNRESRLAKWNRLYVSLLTVAKPQLIELPHAVTSSDRRQSDMDYYERWIVSMYGEEVVRRFGGLEIVDSSLIPVGMVELFRNSKLRWSSQ